MIYIVIGNMTIIFIYVFQNQSTHKVKVSFDIHSSETPYTITLVAFDIATVFYLSKIEC